MPCIEGGIESLAEHGPGDKLRAPGRREQLGSENRSRHHHRMIEGTGLDIAGPWPAPCGTYRTRSVRLRRKDLMARILITGSADGLGRASAQTLLKEGHSVVVHTRNRDRL